jgi:hypothetical protein
MGNINSEFELNINEVVKNLKITKKEFIRFCLWMQNNFSFEYQINKKNIRIKFPEFVKNQKKGARYFKKLEKKQCNF